jgi:hypothetical protein
LPSLLAAASFMRRLVSLRVKVSELGRISAEVSKDAHFFSKRWLGCAVWGELNDLNPFLLRNRTGNSLHVAPEFLHDLA